MKHPKVFGAVLEAFKAAGLRVTHPADLTCPEGLAMHVEALSEQHGKTVEVQYHGTGRLSVWVKTHGQDMTPAERIAHMHEVPVEQFPDFAKRVAKGKQLAA